MKIEGKRYHQYKGKVYDLEVSTSDHSYIVNNVVVHNSAAGCFVAFLLGITKIDPLQYGLLFERFLNEGRLGKVVSESFIILNDSVEFKKGKVLQVTREGQNLSLPVEELKKGDYIEV